MNGKPSNWRQAVCARVSLRINRGLNGGYCPGAGALGECPAVYEMSTDDDGAGASFTAEVFLAPRATMITAATLAEWIEACGGLEPCISHVLHDPFNGTSDGVCLDGARHWLAEFRAELDKPSNDQFGLVPERKEDR